MATTNKNTIKNWFKTGFKPTQAQFWAWLDSYRHNNDAIAITEIQGLAEALGLKLDAQAIANYFTKTEINNKLATKADLVGGKVPAEQLPTNNIRPIIIADNYSVLPTTNVQQGDIAYVKYTYSIESFNAPMNFALKMLGGNYLGDVSDRKKLKLNQRYLVVSGQGVKGYITPIEYMNGADVFSFKASSADFEDEFGILINVTSNKPASNTYHTTYEVEFYQGNSFYRYDGNEWFVINKWRLTKKETRLDIDTLKATELADGNAGFDFPRNVVIKYDGTFGYQKKLKVSSWQNLTLEDGATGFLQARTNGEFVEIQGSGLENLTIGDYFCVLPTTMRPQNWQFILGYEIGATNKAIRLRLESNGQLKLWQASNLPSNHIVEFQFLYVI